MKPTIQSVADIPYGLERDLIASLPEKDIPIVAGAVISGAEALITLDRKHLLGNQRLRVLDLPIKIMTPGDFIQNYFV